MHKFLIEKIFSETAKRGDHLKTKKKNKKEEDDDDDDLVPWEKIDTKIMHIKWFHLYKVQILGKTNLHLESG